MKTLSVVKYLDVPEEVCLPFSPRYIFLSTIDALRLQGSEETFHGRIVPAVSFPAHRSYDSIRPEFFLVLPAGVLAPSVGVEDQPTTRLSFGYGPVKGFRYKVRVDTVPCRPSNYGPGEVLSRRWPRLFLVCHAHAWLRLVLPGGP